MQNSRNCVKHPLKRCLLRLYSGVTPQDLQRYCLRHFPHFQNHPKHPSWTSFRPSAAEQASVPLLAGHRIHPSRTDPAGPYRGHDGNRHYARLPCQAYRRIPPFSYEQKGRTDLWQAPSCIQRCYPQNPAGPLKFWHGPTLPEYRTEMQQERHPQSWEPLRNHPKHAPCQQARPKPENAPYSFLQPFWENPTLQPSFLQWKKKCRKRFGQGFSNSFASNVLERTSLNCIVQKSDAVLARLGKRLTSFRAAKNT